MSSVENDEYSGDADVEVIRDGVVGVVDNIVAGVVLRLAFIDVTRAEEDVAETAFVDKTATEPKDVETTEIVLDEGPGFVAAVWA